MKAYLVVSSFAVAFVTLFFLAAVLLRGVDKPKNLAFCAFGISVFVWVLGHMYWQLADSTAEAAFWLRILVVGSSFIPYTYFHFVCEVTGTRLRGLVRLGYVVAICVASLAFTPLIFEAVVPRMGFQFWPQAGAAFPLYFGGFVLVVMVCFVLLGKQYSVSPAKVRNQNKYLIIGTAIGFSGGATNFPLWMDLPIPPFGHGLSIFYILGIGYSVVKFRLLDFNELVVRTLGLSVSAFVLGAPLALTALAVSPYLHPESQLARFGFWLGGLTVAGMFVLLVGPGVTDFLNRFIESKIAPGRYAYRRKLKELCEGMLAGVEEERIMEDTVTRLHRVLGLDYAAIYIRTELEHSFSLRGQEGERGPIKSLDPAEFPALCDLLQEKRGALFLEEEMERSSRFERSIGPFLAQHREIKKSDLFVPIKAYGMLYGFLLLGSGGRSNLLSDLDLILLENLGAQLGVALKSREVERLSSSMEKLVSLGTMAAGLSHELRNPLVSIRTLSALMQADSTSLSLKPEFSATVQRDIKRIVGIVEGVSAFARESKGTDALVDLQDLLEEVGKIHEDRMGDSGIHYSISSDRNLPEAVGNYDQLLQVFNNIVENAVQAISEWPERPERGEVAVSVRRRGGGLRGRRWLEVSVSDNGPGIPEELRRRIFEPFVTSRDTGTRVGGAGTGLGLAIVNKIIEVHRGAITVSSTQGAGSEFLVSIPCDTGVEA